MSPSINRYTFIEFIKNFHIVYNCDSPNQNLKVKNRLDFEVKILKYKARRASMGKGDISSAFQKKSVFELVICPENAS